MLLPCIHCQHAIAVSASQSGSETTCPACGKTVEIPNLGELRRLQSSGGNVADGVSSGVVSSSQATRRIIFAGLMAIAGTAGIVGIFCLVRYLAIEPPITTEMHIAEVDNLFHQVAAAQLIREWQQMERFGLDAANKHMYQSIADEKASWQTSGLICLGILLLAGGGATIVALTGPRKTDVTVST